MYHCEYVMHVQLQFDTIDKHIDMCMYRWCVLGNTVVIGQKWKQYMQLLKRMAEMH